MHHPENIERQEEKMSGNVEINRCLVIESRLIKGIGGNFGVMAIIV